MTMLSFSMLALNAPTARCDTIVVGSGAFGVGSTLLTFAGLADLSEVNGLIFNGVTFSYSLGNGQVIIDDGPGITNNVNPPNLVSIGNNAGTLSLLLPGFADTFGFGNRYSPSTNKLLTKKLNCRDVSICDCSYWRRS